MKKIIKYFLLFLLVLVIALFLLPYFFQDELKLKLKEYLNDRIEADVEFSDVHLSALARFPKLKLGVDDLLLTKNAQFNNDTIFYADEIVLELPLYSLWEKEKPVEVYQFEINQPKLFVLINEKGQANYNIIPDTGKSESQGEIVFNMQSYNILNGKLVFDDAQSGIYLLLDKLNHAGSGDFSQSSFDLQTETNIGKIQYTQSGANLIEDWKAAISGNLSVDLDNNSYLLNENSILLNQVQLAASGMFKLNPNNTEIDLNFASNKNDFKNYLSLLPNMKGQNFDKIKAGGAADVIGYIKGIFESERNIYPQFNIESNIENAHFQLADFQIPITNISGKFIVQNTNNSIDNTEISLNNFTAKIKEETIKIHARGRNLTTDPLIDCRVEGKLNLNDLSNAYPLPGISQMEGIIATNFHVLGKQSSLKNEKYDDISFEGQMTGESIQVTMEDETYQVPSFGAQWDKQEIIFSTLTLIQGNTNFFAEGRILRPLNILVPNKPVDAQIAINAKRIDLNPYLKVSDADTLLASTSWMQKLKLLNLTWEADIDELNYETYTLLNNEGNGVLSQDKLQINDFSGILSGSDFKISGNLDKVISYTIDNDTISGILHLKSNKLDANKYLEDQLKAGVKSESPYPIIPPRMNIQIVSNANQVQYGLINLANISGNINLLEQKLEMSNFAANLFGGAIKLDGSYQQIGDSQPEFAFKYDMEQIPFIGAAQSLQSIQKFAPLFSFIEGVFNTTLIMNGKLGKDLFPELSSLTAAGYMETSNGNIKSLPYLDKLQSFFTVNMQEAWKLTGTKNWFEIENGTFSLKEYKHVWKDMEFSIAGTHSLNKDISYIIKAKVPKSKINQSSIGKQINQTLDGFINQAVSKGIIKSTDDPYLMLDFKFTGNMKNPLVSVHPKGIAGIELVNPLEQVIKEKGEELKDAAENKINENKEAIEQKVKDKASAAVDSVKATIDKKTNEAIEKGKDKASELLDSTIKNQIPKTIPDSLKTQVDKTIDDLFGSQPKEEIKDKLKDFNPFKKKKKNN